MEFKLLSYTSVVDITVEQHFGQHLSTNLNTINLQIWLGKNNNKGLEWKNMVLKKTRVYTGSGKISYIPTIFVKSKDKNNHYRL